MKRTIYSSITLALCLFLLLAEFPLAGQQKKGQLGDVSLESKAASARRDIVASAEELQCIGFIGPTLLPPDMHISGTREEGKTTFGIEGSMVYLSGSGIKNLKSGEILRVVRPEGKIQDKLSRQFIGYYYKELGIVKVLDVQEGVVSARVNRSCNIIYKGDLVLPRAERPVVKFTQPPSDSTTPFPENALATSILLGKDDLKELAAGHFCFIGVGSKDGVKVGDRFTIYRIQPPFNPLDLIANTSHSATSYEKVQGAPRYQEEIINILKERKLPHRVIGDMVVVDVAETTAAARVVNSKSEISLGDIVVRR